LKYLIGFVRGPWLLVSIRLEVTDAFHKRLKVIVKILRSLSYKSWGQTGKIVRITSVRGGSIGCGGAWKSRHLEVILSTLDIEHSS
jgi:hypothetical protein